MSVKNYKFKHPLAITEAFIFLRFQKPKSTDDEQSFVNTFHANVSCAAATPQEHEANVEFEVTMASKAVDSCLIGIKNHFGVGLLAFHKLDLEQEYRNAITRFFHLLAPYAIELPTPYV